MGGRGSASVISGTPVTKRARKRRMKNFDVWFNAGR